MKSFSTKESIEIKDGITAAFETGDSSKAVDLFVDSNDDSRLVYVEDTGEVHLMTHTNSWADLVITNNSIGEDFDSIWTSDDHLIYAQIAMVDGFSWVIS